MDYELIEHDKDDKYDPAPFLSYARRRAQEMAERDPVVGDTVHHWDGERCRAATVTALAFTFMETPTRVSLTAFPAEGPHAVTRHHGVAYSGEKESDSWHWPEPE